MTTQIIKITEILLDAYCAANQGRSDVPAKYADVPEARHRWLGAYNTRIDELKQQRNAA